MHLPARCQMPNVAFRTRSTSIEPRTWNLEQGKKGLMDQTRPWPARLSAAQRAVSPPPAFPRPPSPNAPPPASTICPPSLPRGPASRCAIVPTGLLPPAVARARRQILDLRMRPTGSLQLPPRRVRTRGLRANANAPLGCRSSAAAPALAADLFLSPMCSSAPAAYAHAPNALGVSCPCSTLLVRWLTYIRQAPTSNFRLTRRTVDRANC